MYVQKYEALKKSWYQNFSTKKVSKMCVQKKRNSQKVLISIGSLNRRSQKCVFIKMKLSKSPDIKNVCSKNETLKKSWYQNFSRQKVSKMSVQKLKLSKSPDIKISLNRRTQKCVFKKNETLKKSWYQNSLHWRSQKCMFKKMKLSKSTDIKISQHRRSQKCVFKKNETLKKSWYQNFFR